MTVTIKDIAREAQVDIGAVSRTLRNHPESLQLRPETRERIWETARKLGYRRNLLAASMRTGQVNMIAVIGSSSASFFEYGKEQIMDGLISECAENGYTVKFFFSNNLEKVFEEICGSLIHHVVCIALESNIRKKIAEYCHRNHLHLIYIYEKSVDSYCSVCGDNITAAKMAVQYLASQGHRKIGLITSTHDFYDYVQKRSEGYLQGLKQAEIVPDKRWILSTEEPDRDMAYFLEMKASLRPTAFLAISESFSIKAQIATIKAGARIPEDFSFVSIGNRYSNLAFCPLTCIEENTDQYGRLAVRILLEKENNLTPDETGCFRVSPKLILRDSVSKLK